MHHQHHHQHHHERIQPKILPSDTTTTTTTTTTTSTTTTSTTTTTTTCEKRREMAQPPPPPQAQPQALPQPPHHPRQHTSPAAPWPRDALLGSPLAAAAAKQQQQQQQHTPLAPSPLNPTLRASDLLLGRRVSQLRTTAARPAAARRPPALSPTLRFLKRKAYFGYQAHQLARGVGDIVRGGGGGGGGSDAAEAAGAAAAPGCRAPAEEAAEGPEEHMPAAFIVESGSLLHVIHFDCSRRGAAAADVEKQGFAHHPSLPPWQSPQQRLQFFFLLCLMSACLTSLTVLSLGALKTDRYHHS